MPDMASRKSTCESACADASLPSIVRRVTRGDVPTSIWWADDFSRVPPIAPLFGMVRQVVYDSRSWRDVQAALRSLRPVLQDPDAPQLADVNWRRLTSMRYAIVHAARTMLTRAETIRNVEVRHRPGERAIASLLVGWLAARLGWSEGPPLAHIEETRHGDELLTVTFDGVTADDERQPHRRAVAKRRSTISSCRPAGVRGRRRRRRAQHACPRSVPARRADGVE